MRVKRISKTELKNAGNTYNALFKIKGLNKRLVRSFVEINNNSHINMWRNCFDRNGRFSRAKFNQYRYEFENWENAFSVIWLDLKSINRQEDRTAIVNCLVRFIKDSDRIDQYIDFILKDFFYYPLHLHYSDMNALIFTNMFLFKHYAVHSSDFEITPEEVLISRNEKNTLLVDRLASLLDSSWGDRFIEKINTIKKNLYLTLDPQKRDQAQLPAETLIKLLREVFIFLTLVGATSGYKTVRDMVEEFSSLDSELYTSRFSQHHLKGILKLLQLFMRCLILLGNEDDIELLRLISIREKEFIALKGFTSADLSHHTRMVKVIMQIAAEGIVILDKKGKNSNINPMNDDELKNALEKTFELE
jgi:hypothetical protein